MPQLSFAPSPGARSDSLRVRHPLPRREREESLLRRRATNTWEQAVKLRLDADVLAAYRKTGHGWQTRINADLRKARKLKAG